MIFSQIANDDQDVKMIISQIAIWWSGCLNDHPTEVIILHKKSPEQNIHFKSFGNKWYEGIIQETWWSDNMQLQMQT